MTNKLIELLKYEGPNINTEFDKASISGRGTPQEVAEFREGYFHKFIGKYFPFPHRVAKGNIIDSFGNESASIDTILINPIHPYTIDTCGKFSVIFADGVDFVIEVKPDISTKAELHRGLKQIQSVKKLKRSKSPSIFASKTPPIELIEHSRQIPSFIFSLKCESDPISTGKSILAFYKSNSIPIENQLDYLIINEVGIIANYKYPSISKDVFKRTGLFFEEWGELTIPAFLLYSNLVHHAAPAITKSVIERYIPKISPNSFIQIKK